MKKHRKKSLQGYLLIFPLLAGCLLFYIVPFGMIFWYSFRSSTAKSSRFVGGKNYLDLLQNDIFLVSCKNTLRFLLIGILLIFLLSYLIALLLRSQTERYSLLKSVLLCPYIMPIVGTISLIELLFSGFQLEAQGSFWTVVLLYLWKNTGYSVILLLSGLMTIPKEQYASASLDGADVFQKFLYITTPQMWHTIFFSLVFSLINAFKCFREIFLIAGKYPNRELYLLQHFINNSFENLNYVKLSAASVLLFLFIMIWIGAAYSWVKRRERYKE